MRTRIASFAAAAILSISAFAISPGVALMAAQQFTMCSFNDGAASIAVTYDDVTGAISSLTETNNGPAGTLSYVIRSTANGQVIRSGTVNLNTGSHTFNISALGLSMTKSTNPKNGATVWTPPYTTQCSWG